jgi:eukaryotic-like serine/threonine-protein kinase
MIKYVTSRPLWFNILVALLIVILLFIIFMLSLNWITKHGVYKKVPSVTGKNINDVVKQLDEAGFELVLQDSVYYDSLPRGIVIKQVPEADQVVKVNRTVYVIINRFVAPDISMPNLVGFSLRNAELSLKNLGLKIGDTTYKPDFAKGSILEMSLNGKELKPGDKIKVGSVIDLVIAGGQGEETMSVPKLVGMSYAEAKILAEANGLSIIPIANGITDIDRAYVYKQEPNPKTPDGAFVRIRQGQMMTVWLQTEPVNTDTLNNNNQTPQLP